MRPLLATDRISLGFWLNIRFVVDYRGAVRSIVGMAIDLLISEDLFFLWITAVPLPRRCLQSRRHSGSRMCGVTLALSGPPNLRPESDHRYLILLLFHQPILSHKLYLPSVQSVVLVQTQLQYNWSSWKTWFVSASALTSNPPFLLVAADGRQRNQPCDCAMTWAFHVLQKICRIRISQQFISTFGCNITLSLQYLGHVTVFQ